MIAIYCRTSKEDKDFPGMSIPAQRDNGIKHAKELYGENVQCEIYLDADRSGDLPPRQWLPPQRSARVRKYKEGLTRLIEDIEAGKVHGIVIRKLDRLSRYKTEDGLKLFRYLAEKNIKIHATSETISDLKTASGVLNLTILMAIASFEKSKISDNISSTLQNMRDNGLKYHAAKSYGYKDGLKTGGKGTGTIEIEEGEAKIVKEAFSVYLEEKTIGSVVRYLNDNYPMQSKSGGEWKRAVVSRMLKNVNYIGMIQIKSGEIFPSVYPPIISNEDFSRAQKLQEANKGQRGEDKACLLTGLMHCAYCGSKMYTIYEKQYGEGRKEKIRVYTCRECKAKTKPIMIIEKKWDRFIKEILKNEMTIKESSSKEAEINIKLNNLKQTRDSFIENASKGLLTIEELNKFLATSNKNIEKLEAEKEEEKGKKTTRNIKILEWDKLSIQAKREYLFSIFEKIEVYKDGVMLIYKDGVETSFDNELERLGAKKVFYPAFRTRGKRGGFRNDILPPKVNAMSGWIIDNIAGEDVFCKEWGEEIHLIEGCKPLDIHVEKGKRYCPRCNEIKDETEFYVRKSGKIESACKECKRKQAREAKKKCKTIPK